jgi:hypothetical protein
MYFHYMGRPGGDEVFAEIAERSGHLLIVHPVGNSARRLPDPVEVRSVRDPIDASHDIIEESEAVILLPDMWGEGRKRNALVNLSRRYAKKQNKSVYTIQPNGVIVRELAEPETTEQGDTP